MIEIPCLLFVQKQGRRSIFNQVNGVQCVMTKCAEQIGVKLITFNLFT